MSDDQTPPGLRSRSFARPILQRERQALIDLTREAAAAGLAPGFPKDGPKRPRHWLGVVLGCGHRASAEA